ncbi:serine-type endopeptidase inhibitor, putative [Ricinus communis]|uniref:Serine-type endopeptidase inhibitor, putative n=1 Tax=Ricinus communis TaxID=3988 RepID=B9S0U3_RICCO|nr:serine-type endopeptidase inhibitor, putative [Ricinus communis]
MIPILFPFSDSTFRRPIFLFLIFSLCLIPVLRSDPNPIRLPTHIIDNQDDNVDPCGEYGRPVSCPVNCFRTDPVCGVDGVTYWCGCRDAWCAGTKVAKKGFCEVGNNGAAAQALLLLHIVWLIVLGFCVLFGIF